MTPFLSTPLPESAYFRLLEYQKKRRLSSYQPDYPLVFFIFFSRIASGLSILSVFFPSSISCAAIAPSCMVLATLASILHLSVPWRFLTMMRNNKSYLVWEIRLAGALTVCLGMQFLSSFGWFPGLCAFLPGINLVLGILFLISTGWAYRFETHPAWKTFLLPMYYVTSGLMAGLALRSIEYQSAMIPLLYAVLLVAEAFLIALYRNHLKTASPGSFKKMVMNTERWVSLAFSCATLLLPALITIALLLEGNVKTLQFVLIASCLIGIFLERILFFWMEKPIYFLSFIENPKKDEKYPYWVRG